MTWIVSLGWCECGAALGKTQIDGRWYWMHDGQVGAAIQDDKHAGIEPEQFRTT